MSLHEDDMILYIENSEDSTQKILVLMNEFSKLAGYKINIQKSVAGASLVVQWLRICLLVQGTWVRALVWEDPTCRGATKPVSHNY